MLVKIGKYVINTQTITVVKEEGGCVVVYFNSDYLKYIELPLSLNQFIKHLNSVGATIHG